MKELKKWMILCLLAVVIFVASSACATCYIKVCLYDREGEGCDDLVWGGVNCKIVIECDTLPYIFVGELTANCDSFELPSLACHETYGLRIYAWDDWCSPNRISEYGYVDADSLPCTGTIEVKLCLVPDDINCL